MDMMWYRRRGLMVTPHIERATGAIASFNSDYNKIPVKSLICDIEPIQEGSGDPSPDNIRPICGRPGLSVVRAGVNVWDEETEYGYYSVENGQAGSSINTQLRSKNYISVKPSTSYCYKKPNNLGDILFYDANKSYISALLNVGSNRVFTTPGNCYYIRLNLGSVYGNTYNHDIGLNYPATNIEYHAYKGSTYSVNWETEAGTVYGGTLDVMTGVLMVDRLNADLGSLDWASWNDGASLIFNTSFPGKTYQRANADCISSMYKYRGDVFIWSNLLNGEMTGSSQNDRIYFRNTAYNDNASFKAGMSGVQVVYTLAEPITYQLTPQEIRTLLGTNNIWCDSGDVTVDYWRWENKWLI